MPPLRIRHAPHQRARSCWAALWLAVGASLVGLVSACTVSPPAQNLPQHSAAPRHTIYVSYWRFQKPVKTPADLLGNPAAFIVAAMTTSDGTRVWQTTLLDNPAVGQGGSASYYTLVSGPIVYVIAAVGQLGVVAALDAYTGKILWKRDTGADPINEVRVANGVLYLWLGLRDALRLCTCAYSSAPPQGTPAPPMTGVMPRSGYTSLPFLRTCTYSKPQKDETGVQ